MRAAEVDRHDGEPQHAAADHLVQVVVPDGLREHVRVPGDVDRGHDVRLGEAEPPQQRAYLVVVQPVRRPGAPGRLHPLIRHLHGLPVPLPVLRLLQHGDDLVQFQ